MLVPSILQTLKVGTRSSQKLYSKFCVWELLVTPSAGHKGRKERWLVSLVADQFRFLKDRKEIGPVGGSRGFSIHYPL